jgi:hypothetical protein
MVTNLEAEKQSVQTRKFVTVVAAVVALTAVVALAAGIFLIVRGSDLRRVDNHIDTKISQTEKAFCTFMEQQAQNRTNAINTRVSNEAINLIHMFGCTSKGPFTP